ncbi:hypothetical protein FSARC_13398 [Fusarium sarcochroum]|uniref:Uncharacterized protein n=1 Tax=Fusarium sarcochroum TaxID=1208366 RepID=A0A8H4T1V0_9HYPO|nr:hypothetical protein FSARC_13398 [Fusarium sarcochroum]
MIAPELTGAISYGPVKNATLELLSTSDFNLSRQHVAENPVWKQDAGDQPHHAAIDIQRLATTSTHDQSVTRNNAAIISKAPGQILHQDKSLSLPQKRPATKWKAANDISCFLSRHPEVKTLTREEIEEEELGKLSAPSRKFAVLFAARQQLKMPKPIPTRTRSPARMRSMSQKKEYYGSDAVCDFDYEDVDAPLYNESEDKDDEDDEPPRKKAAKPIVQPHTESNRTAES